MADRIRRAVYPGSFNPPTIAHMELSAVVRDQRNVDVVVWTLSRQTLGKDPEAKPTIKERTAVLRAIAARRYWLEVQVTDAQLLSDIAHGFDVLIMGADKWEQINSLEWYPDAKARDEALASLPEIAIGPRPPHRAPQKHLVDLSGVEHVSSTAVRAGNHELMLPEARASRLWEPR
jgi:nicotinic acid mononucleotide adenylyltransferase